MPGRSGEGTLAGESDRRVWRRQSSGIRTSGAEEVSERVETEAGAEAWPGKHRISSSSRRSAGHPREGAKKGFSWHGSKEGESRFRLC